MLSIDNPAGPSGYDIPKEADVTVVLYTKRNVKVNHAFKKGELTEKDVDKRIREVRQETGKAVLFETRDREHKGAFLRRSYIAR